MLKQTDITALYMISEGRFSFSYSLYYVICGFVVDVCYYFEAHFFYLLLVLS